jgi:hypothetical protein
MREDLDEYLCKTYPKMFVQRHMSEMDTCMCWGFACGDGWFNILDQLCGNIQHHIDWKNREEETVTQVVVTQVKEKFGTLRFYYNGGDAFIDGLVVMAESMSGVTCEECGSTAKTSNVDPEKGITGWVHTTCLPCQAKRKRQQAEFVVDSLRNDIL